MDYDVLYVGDGRNADHRPRPAGWRPSGNGPAGGSRTVVIPPTSRPTVITGNPPYAQPYPYMYQGYPYMPYPAGPMPGDSSIASRFGMSTGELIDTGLQLLAAVLPLPGAPNAQGEVSTDVENLITYQGALAVHAKRDEQFRTLGTLLARILR